MSSAQFWYLSLAPTFFLILIGLFSFFVALPLGPMQYAYKQLGTSATRAVLLLTGSFIGSYINIPIEVISQKSVMASQMIDFYGMRYQVPTATDWGGTALAINVGVIPANSASTSISPFSSRVAKGGGTDHSGRQHVAQGEWRREQPRGQQQDPQRRLNQCCTSVRRRFYS